MNRLSEGVIELNDIEVFNNCSYSCYANIADALNQLKIYEDLEEQGLLIKLPCKHGDTVWFIKSAFSMTAFPIEANYVSIRGINCDEEINYTAITAYNKIERRFTSADIGKTVFLTREEAEKALEGSL